MKMQQPNRSFRFVALVAAVAGALFAIACDLAGQEFRTVSASSLQQGVTQVVTGIIDGAFAAYTPDDVDNNSTTTTDTTNSTDSTDGSSTQ